MKYLIVFVCLSLSLSCKTAKQPVVQTGNEKVDVMSVANSIFTERYTIEPNKDNTFSIVTKKNKKLKDLFPELDFFVYDHEAREIILRDTLKAGNVGWSSDYTLKAIARNLSDDDSGANRSVYVYDVRTRSEVPGSSTSESADESTEVYTTADRMPRFPGCEEEEDLQTKKKCAQQTLLNYIYNNVKYPAESRANGIEGTVVIRFKVNGEGGVEDAEVLKSLDEACDEEALRVIEEMPIWIPGIQRGKQVAVYMNMPIRFGL